MTKAHKLAGLLMIAAAMHSHAQGPVTAAKPAIAAVNSTQKIESAGLQFLVPKGWTLEEKTGPTGPAYRLSSKDGATFGFIPTTEDDLPGRVDTIHDAVEKAARNFEQGPEQTLTVNDLEYVHQSDIINGGESFQDVGYVMGKIPVILLLFGHAAPMEANDATLQEILQSVQKVAE